MESALKLHEPIVDRHTETQNGGRRRRVKPMGPSFFTLSGGILKRDHRTANRIDSVLSKMILDSESDDYSPHVDRNLDYLQTCLQLDMISMVAEEYRPTDLDAADEDEGI